MKKDKNLFWLIYKMFIITVDCSCHLEESWKISLQINNSFPVSLDNRTFPTFLFDFILF